MSEALERLKNIGAQKIYEDTHIPVGHVQAILYESFDGLSKVQFIGFISILEREYGVDLNELREHCNRYFEENESCDDAITDDTLFKAPSSKKNLAIYYIVGAIILLLIAIFYTMQSADKTLKTSMKESPTVAKVERTIMLESNASDLNKSDENSSTLKTSLEANTTKEITTQKPEAVEHSFIIKAKTKVWLGYIDVATNKKYQKTFVGEFELDPTKEWLLYFGHGYVDIIIDGKREEFNDRNTLRLHYEDGKIEKLSLREFKELNRGNAW